MFPTLHLRCDEILNSWLGLELDSRFPATVHVEGYGRVRVCNLPFAIFFAKANRLTGPHVNLFVALRAGDTVETVTECNLIVSEDVQITHFTLDRTVK